MNKTAYLTIDDGPSKEAKEKLNFLVKNDIPAVWFCWGKNLEKREEKAIKIIREGHVIGNHSYDHPQFSELTLEQIKKQINKTDQIIDEIYEEAREEREHKYFRFPYLTRGFREDGNSLVPKQKKSKERSKKIQQFLKKLGYNKPDLGITYDSYQELGCKKWIDFHFTYYPKLEKIDNEVSLKEVLEEIRQGDCRATPEAFTSKDSNESIMTHDHPGNWSGKTTERNIQIFKKVIKEIKKKNLDFKLP